MRQCNGADAMPGDFLRRQPQLSLEVFHAFRDSRPEEEKWELIDGVPLRTPPPTLVHQRIGSNLAALLNARLRLVKPERQADYAIGLLVPGDEKYNPEPDVTVIDAEIRVGQLYAERFYLVAEILSESDKPEVIAAKLAYYQSHQPNQAVLLVRQDRLGVTVHSRLEPSRWSEGELTAAGDMIELPEIGPVGTVGQLYRDTPLDPAKAG
jgi:Uma2 family endonuclease